MWRGKNTLKNNEFSTGTHGTQLWMSCSASWCQSARVSVIRHKQNLSNSAEGHEGRFRSCRISIIAILYYINSLGKGGNLQWKRLECLLGCALSNWLWRPQADGLNRAVWMQAKSPSVCMHARQSVWYLSINLFTMCVFVRVFEQTRRLLELTLHIHSDDLGRKPGSCFSWMPVSKMSFHQRCRYPRKRVVINMECRWQA